MKKNIALIDLALLVLVIALVAYYRELFFPIYVSHALDNPSPWYLLTHRSLNATFWWLDTGLPFNITSTAGMVISLALLATGITLGIQTRDKPSKTLLSDLCVSATVPLMLILILGFDYPVFIITTQITLTLLSMLSARAPISQSAAASSLLLLAAASNLFFCNQFSPYLLALLTIHLLYRLSNSPPAAYRYRLIGAVSLLTLFLIWSVLLQLKRPALPEFGYAGNARVVPDDGISGNVTPLIGESTVIPFLDRMAVHQSFYLSALIVSLILTLLLLRKRSERDNIWISCAVLAIALFWDTVIPESFATLGPIETIRRILPGTFPFALTPIVFSLSLVFSAILSANTALRGALLALLIPLAYASSPGFANAARPAEQLSEIFSSPSHALLKQESPAMLQSLRNRNEYRLISVAELDGTVTTSHRNKPKNKTLLSDGRSDTRWSPKRGAQYGDEWVEIHFPKPVTFIGVQTLPGKYFSDFPRGIALVSCDAQSVEKSAAANVIKQLPDWQGGIELTAQGYPYFTGQHDVTVILENPVTLSCLRISQTSESPNFDWSIAEIRLMLPPEK